MQRNVICLGWVLLLSGLPWLAQSEANSEPDPTPDSGLVETTQRRLIQLDVTVGGPREAISDLTRDDFELIIGGRNLDSFIVDNLCRLEAETEVEPVPEEPTADSPQPTAAAGPPRARVSYLIYFDQRHLTMAGRQNALDIARDLIRELVVDGNRATVVSAGRELRTFVELTDNVNLLLRAIDEVGRDPRQWDPQAINLSEDTRVDEVVATLNRGDIDEAITLARRYQREETWETGKSLRLFSLVLGRMADLDPPKAVIYFADTMRKNAGAHYLSFFGQRALRGDDAALSAMSLDTFAAANSFDRVLEEATAHGVRLYTIQAEGLVSASSTQSVSGERAAGGTDANLAGRRVKHAQDSLVGFALESGGEAFLNGVRSGKIAKSIRDDLSCIYLFSFDAADLPRNRSLPVRVRTSRPRVKPHARGLIVIQSESRQLSSRLLAAFAAPDTIESDTVLQGVIIPMGYEDGRYQALVQVSVPGSVITVTEWDMGISLVSRGKVREDAAGRVSVKGAGLPVVFEAELSFKPGPFELIAVAHEVTGDAVSTKKIDGSWPDPDEAPATIGPIVVIQPTEGAFLRDTVLRRKGSRALAPGELARTDFPTAIVAIVCRGRQKKGMLQIERRLVGDSAAPFAPTDIDLKKDRCAVLSDLIPADAMSSGLFEYQISVLDRDDNELLTHRFKFGAASPDEHPALADLADR